MKLFSRTKRYVCNFLLNISQALDNNEFQASLTVQAARPVYNSSYHSPLVNFMDESVAVPLCAISVTGFQ